MAVAWQRIAGANSAGDSDSGDQRCKRDQKPGDPGGSQSESVSDSRNGPQLIDLVPWSYGDCKRNEPANDRNSGNDEVCVDTQGCIGRELLAIELLRRASVEAPQFP